MSSSTAGLRDGRPMRLSSAAPASLCAEVAGAAVTWIPEGDHERAVLSSPPLASAIAEALKGLGLPAPTSLRLLRHGPLARGLPAVSGLVFLLDLTDGRSQDGGLLLFGEERVEGWHPEAGALTVFDGSRPPLLTLVTATAKAPRLSVFGTLA